MRALKRVIKSIDILLLVTSGEKQHRHWAKMKLSNTIGDLLVLLKWSTL